MAKNTTVLLQRLRSLMSNVSPAVNAYIVPAGDAHLSEYIAACDERRAFISGFTGSAGTAIVTETKAAMWTDGRYYLQARAQMDDNWQLMKDGLPDTPSQADWLCKELPNNGRVGVDPFLMSAATWKTLNRQLVADGHTLVPIDRNLIDAIWDDAPVRPQNAIFVQPLKFAGQQWFDKVTQVRAKLAEKNAVALLVSALDEIAWLLNLRGSDISFNPVFFAYVIVTADTVRLFVDASKLNDEVRSQLNGSSIAVDIHPYADVTKHLQELVTSTSGKIWISDKSSYALYHAVPKRRVFNEPTPVGLMKAVKNEVEIQGMRNAHIKDAVALCQFFSWLEKEAPSGNLTEIIAADYAEMFRKKQDDYVSLSFSTISAVGSNAAVIHYRPAEETNKKIDLDHLYLLDSGAQYRDGTTDVTRTVHLGNPSIHEKECFTRVLKGHIELARVVFPNGTKGFLLDTLARRALWQAGLDYQHGTGHGVGSFLNVHEGPCGIGYRVRSDDVPLEKGMILSDEPGYYEDSKFGIRIESLVLVTEANTQFNFKNKGFLTFEPITLVPIQSKLIVKDMLTPDEIEWINDYHRKCREVIGPELKKLEDPDPFNWLMNQTDRL